MAHVGCTWPGCAWTMLMVMLQAGRRLVGDTMKVTKYWLRRWHEGCNGTRYHARQICSECPKSHFCLVTLQPESTTPVNPPQPRHANTFFLGFIFAYELVRLCHPIRTILHHPPSPKAIGLKAHIVALQPSTVAYCCMFVVVAPPT